MFEWLIQPKIDRSKYDKQQIGAIIITVDDPVSLAGADLAIIGVMESAGNPDNENCAYGADRVREYFYQLYDHDKIRIADLGNIKSGAELTDTYFALEQVCELLIKNDVIPIVLGGSQDLTQAQFSALAKHNHKINMTVIDERVDMLEQGDISKTYLREMITRQGDKLFNLCHIGAQAHFVAKSMLDTIDRLNFDLLRLGAVRENIQVVEPELRDTDLLSVDVAAIRKSDAPGFPEMSPNGLFGEEICRIMRYAGISDRLTSMGIYEFNPEYDAANQSSQLVAQMIWYFIDGYYSRKSDRPLADSESYLKYTIPVADYDKDMVFIKSKKSDRWWMELVYYIEGEAKSELISCTYQDYELAMNGDIPDRWLKANARFI